MRHMYSAFEIFLPSYDSNDYSSIDVLERNRNLQCCGLCALIDGIIFYHTIDRYEYEPTCCSLDLTHIWSDEIGFNQCFMDNANKGEILSNNLNEKLFQRLVKSNQSIIVRALVMCDRIYLTSRTTSLHVINSKFRLLNILQLRLSPSITRGSNIQMKFDWLGL